MLFRSVVDLLRHDRDDFRLRAGQQRNGFDPEELRALLEAAGLELDHCAPLAPEPEAKGPALLMAAAARPALPTVAIESHAGGARAARATERKKS